jgi:TPP-dependent 2-oxoacid decarboxylase
MNAVAGAYAEQVPLVVLVGSPRTTQRRSAMLLHHSVGDLGTMQQAYSHITSAAVLLDDPAEAPQRIDHALARCIAEKRPIMIEIPIWSTARALHQGPLLRQRGRRPIRMRSPRRSTRPWSCFQGCGT